MSLKLYPSKVEKIVVEMTEDNGNYAKTITVDGRSNSGGEWFNILITGKGMGTVDVNLSPTALRDLRDGINALLGE